MPSEERPWGPTALLNVGHHEEMPSTPKWTLTKQEWEPTIWTPPALGPQEVNADCLHVTGLGLDSSLSGLRQGPGSPGSS